MTFSPLRGPILGIMALFLFLAHPVRAQENCSLPTTAMDQEFYNLLKTSTDGEKRRLLILPFLDASGLDPDETLQNLFPVILHDLLTAWGFKGLHHPFVVWDHLEKTNFPQANLFEDDAVLSLAKELKATHILYGTAQRQPQGMMRYFIKVVEVSSGQPLGSMMEFVTEEGDRFFSVAQDAAASVLSRLGGGKRGAVTIYGLQWPHYGSFRFYVKGLEKSRRYDENSLSIADAWFNKAFTESYAFSRAMHERARTFLMRALLQKQKGLDSAQSVGEARRLLTSLPSDWKGNAGLAGMERLWRGNDAFVMGVTAYGAGNFAQAAKFLQQAVGLVPEDGLAHHYLAKSYERTKGTSANREKTLASQLNPCLK